MRSPTSDTAAAGQSGWWPLALSFTLALFLNWGGVALQSGAIYLFALIVPLIIWYRRGLGLAPQLPGIATELALLWLIFPVGNLVIWGLDQFLGGFILPAAIAAKPYGKGLMSSHIPSTVIAVAIILGAAAAIFRSRGPSTDPSPSSYAGLWRQVLLGYSGAVLVVAGYAAVQYVTGLDVRTDSGMINPGNLMPSGFYRVHGFYGHTLSFASNALALCTFFAVLALKLRSLTLKPYAKLSRLCWWLAGVMAVFIYLAGSRGVMAAAAVMALAVGVSFLGRYRRPVLALLTGAVLLAGGLVAMVGLEPIIAALLDGLGQLPGIGERFAPLAERLKAGQLDDIPRLVFWRTHWQMILDQPILGHGYAFMSETTELYYRQLGLGDYFRKYNAHNVYLQFVAEAGIVGLILLVAILRSLWQKLGAWAAGSGWREAWLQAFYWSVAANAVHGLTQNTFFDANVVAVYVLLLALVVWLPRASDEQAAT